MYISQKFYHRSSILFVLILFIVGGCSSNQNVNTDSSSVVSESGTQEEGTDSNTRTFTHKMGTINVPNHPKRIIGLYVEDQLQALGVKPVMQWGSGGQTRS